MAVDISFFLAPLAIARRAGVSGKRYVTKDGYMILDSRDIRKIRFTPEEMVNGIKDLNPISKLEAENLIVKNGYQMGEQAVMDVLGEKVYEDVTSFVETIKESERIPQEVVEELENKEVIEENQIKADKETSEEEVPVEEPKSKISRKFRK